jgi:hypothetical protein
MVLDLDAEMMDRRSGTDHLGFGVVFAVVDRQREIDIAVGHVARDVPARAAGLDLAKTVNVLVESGGGLEIGHLQRDVVDPRHARISYWP